jgi:hypothetical protein
VTGAENINKITPKKKLLNGQENGKKRKDDERNKKE